MKKVLITGISGFTGYYLRTALLEKGYKPIGIVERNEQASFDDIACNLLDKTKLTSAIAHIQPDYVIHLAGISSPAHSNPLDFYHVNVFGTLNLLEAIASEDSRVSKIIIASSANIYRPSAESSIISESSKPSPRNHYAMSKLAMEYLIDTWSDRLPILITRPFNYTGKGQPEQFLIPKIVAHFKHKRPTILLGNLDVVREFNDVRMIAQAYVGLLVNEKINLPINLCSGKGYSLMNVIQICQQLTGHEINFTVDPKLVRTNETPTLIGDPKLLCSILPNLDRYSLPDTLGWMLE